MKKEFMGVDRINVTFSPADESLAGGIGEERDRVLQRMSLEDFFAEAHLEKLGMSKGDAWKLSRAMNTFNKTSRFQRSAGMFPRFVSVQEFLSHYTDADKLLKEPGVGKRTVILLVSVFKLSSIPFDARKFLEDESRTRDSRLLGRKSVDIPVQEEDWEVILAKVPEKWKKILMEVKLAGPDGATVEEVSLSSSEYSAINKWFKQNGVAFGLFGSRYGSDWPKQRIVLRRATSRQLRNRMKG